MAIRYFGDRTLPAGGGLSMMVELHEGVPYVAIREVLTSDQAWGVEYLLALKTGRLVVEQVRVFASGVAPSSSLTTRLLRSVTIGTHIDRASDIYRELMAFLETKPVPAHFLARIREDMSLLSAPRGRRPGQSTPAGARRGRKPLGDAVLLAAARDYVAAQKKRHHAPVLSVAKAGKMSESRARDLIYRARRRGFLSHTDQGRGGGQLTEEALKLLQDAPVTKPRRSRR